MDVSDARIALTQLVKDDLAEKVQKLFKAFLTEFLDESPTSSSQDTPSENLKPKYLDEALELIVKPERNTLLVDFRDLIAFDQELANDVSLDMYRFYPYLCRALTSFINDEKAKSTEGMDQISVNDMMNKDFYIGFYGFEQLTKLRELRSVACSQLVKIVGQVVRTHTVFPELISATFECMECNTEIPNVEQQFKYTLPTICRTFPMCTNRTKFRLLLHKSRFVDFQKVRIQELQNDLPRGSIPRNIDVILRGGDMVECVQPGDRAEFTGCLITVPDIAQMITGGAGLVKSDSGATGDAIRGLKALGIREMSHKIGFMACSVTLEGSEMPIQFEERYKSNNDQIDKNFKEEELRKIDEMSNDKNLIELYVYDLSKGKAKEYSKNLFGKELSGIWHTSVIAYSREFYFGREGIIDSSVCGSGFGKPVDRLPLGQTEVPYSLFKEYLVSLNQHSFAKNTYDFFEHNCNVFSNEVALFLTGREIPSEILDLPNKILSTPVGQVIYQIMEKAFGVNVKRKKSQSEPEQTKQRPQTPDSASMADAEQTPPVAENDVQEEDDKPFVSSLPARRSYKYDDSPIIFRDVDGTAALQKVEEMVIGMLNPQQQEYLKELGTYLGSEDVAWAIGEEHIQLIVYLLSGGEGKFAPNVTLLTLEVLQAMALKEDVVLILHQDRKDHCLMSYINRIESLTLAEQEEIVKLLCNLCAGPSAFDWLFYISEWSESDGTPSSNSRVTVRAAVHTLLNEQLTTLQRNGIYLIYNLSLKEVFEDVAIELSTAVLQYLQHSDVPEDQALLCLTVISRFIVISATNVPALIKMLGLDLGKYKGKSGNIDKLIEEIEGKVAKLPNFDYQK